MFPRPAIRNPQSSSDSSFPIGNRQPAVGNSGVSLIIVLGILLLISLIVLSFVRMTLDSRDTVQLATERLRSDHLLHTAFGRAMDDVNRRMAGTLFFTSIPYDTARGDDCIVSTNGTTTNYCDSILTPTVLAEIPSMLTNEVVLMATNACQWLPMDSGSSGRYAYVVVNLSGFLDANRVGGGMTSSNRTDPAELDISDLFTTPSDAESFILNRDAHVRYDTRDELYRLFSITNLHTGSDSLVTFSYDPDPDVYFTNTTNIGTRLFATNLFRKTCITNVSYATLRSVLTSNSISNADPIATCILDYQDTNRVFDPSWVRPETNQITEAVPLLNELLITTNTSPSNLIVTLEVWYPFFPTPSTNEEFQLSVTANSDPTFATNYPLTDLNFTNFPTRSFEVTVSPTTNFNIRIAVEWRGTSTDPWTPIHTYEVPNAVPQDYSLDDPRDVSTMAHDLTANSIGLMNTNCNAWGHGCQGLPIYHPNRPMQNIGELGYIWTGEPWKTLDLTQTNVAALLDRFTVRGNTPVPRHGLVSAGTTNSATWETMFLSIPIGHTNTLLSYAGKTTSDDAFAFADYMSKRGVFDRTYAELLPDIGRQPCYSSFLTNNTLVGADQREDILRGIVELLSFRQQLYLVVVAAQTLAADGRTVTADRRGLALVWRDGYTGQYFVRNFRWITD